MRLMLRHNGLERVSRDWLIGLERSLMELFIVEPQLRSLSEDALVHLNSLEAVTIQSNLMKRYPVFSGLPKLRYLQLESLSLVELSPRNFKDLPSLQTINIANSPRLTRLEASFLQDLPRLSLVNISYCGIEWMHPRAIYMLPSLRELVLVGNKIVDVGMVGRAIRDLPRLEVLRLDHNYIDKIGEAAFVDLPSLTKLYLSNNQINELEYGAFHRVPGLRSLDLNKNMVRRVHPESFLQHSGSGLEDLWLIDNDISHISELRSLLDALPRLIFLDMSNNNLEAIPFGALRGHPTLERLHLDYNHIHLIDREAFMAMPALRELRLKNNSLSEVLQGPFWNLPALKGLDLSGNFYRRLDPLLLANLPSLRRIDLSGNEIVFIEPGTFLPTPELEHVNLSFNALSTLHPATFRHLLNLYDLDVSHNYLIEFVPNLPRGIEYVHIGHNNIKELPLPPSPDLDLPSLRMLDISNNEVRGIPPNCFRTLPQLRRLYVGGNLLHKLGDNSLSGLNRLEVIDLRSNKITQVHPNSLRQMPELKELNLRNNRLEVIYPEIFQDVPNLLKLDISRNKIAEIPPATMNKTRQLQYMDVSHNLLVQLPPNLFGMKHLKTLDLTHNRLKNLQVETLSSLDSLRELKLASNFIQELNQGAFNGLQHLRALHLDSNELEVVEANAIRALPALKSLRMSRNKLKEIPNFAFNNLPSLQTAELQDNQIRNIGNKAFYQVPNLLMLNLSNNHLTRLEEAGLRSLKSLEMLDVGNNKISRITGPSLQNLEWLVELRVNDNNICAVHGTPFDGMSRLRVLNLRNNKMMTLPEQTMQRLRGNIAVLDIDGNPLACTCGLLWLQEWLQEGSSMGPRCADGTLLRELRFSRQDCPPAERNSELVAPGCEAELLSAPDSFGTSQVFSPWSKLKSTNATNQKITNKNQLAPSPEESEYFYDEYIDYPYNETTLMQNSTTQLQPVENTTPKTPMSPHYISGDTPTLYAAPKNKTKEVPKEVPNSPSSSGFTFFGVPLPSLNLNNILGTTGGKTANKKVSDNTPVADTTRVADRKTAIVNKPTRTGARGSLGLPHGLPKPPEIQTGGFIPLLPGSGGFKPIMNPVVHIEKVETGTTGEPPQSTEASAIRKYASMGHPIPTPSPTAPPITEASTTVGNISVAEDVKGEVTVEPPQSTTMKPKLTTVQVPDIETQANSEKFEDIFDDVLENITTSTTTQIVPVIAPQYSTSTEPFIITSNTPEDSMAPFTPAKELPEKKTPTPLSALLIPGGQQPEFRPAGRPTITKVISPHISGSAPLQANLGIDKIPEPLPQNRMGKTKLMKNENDNDHDDTSWYFANYNKTNLEPYVGTPVSCSWANSNSFHLGNLFFNVILISGVNSVFCRFL